ncbi:hypothetical protein J4411_03985 [Candidatus Pacearchaeota archaeon]|nr:hypothetical protein [Candidatus Pacearchaeota archaeon]
MAIEKNLEKKLGVWRVDKIVGEDKQAFASDYYCVKCYKENKLVQAEVFWPIIDPDIPAYPYCRPCKNKLCLKLILAMGENKN